MKPHPMIFMLAWLACAALATPAAAAAKADAGATQWMKVLLQGKQIGHIEHTRRVSGDTVINTERFEASLARAGTALNIVTEETHRESRDGTPLGFSTLTDMGGVVMHSEGVIAADGALSMIFRQGKQIRTEQARYPQGALLTEGARLREEAAALKPGAQLAFQMYVPSQMEAVAVTSAFVGDERIQIEGKSVNARHTTQTMALAGGNMVVQNWADADGQTLRSLTPMFGMEFEMVATTRRAAAHRDDATDLLQATVLESPRAITREERQGDLRYHLVLADPAIAAALPRGEQQVTTTAGTAELLIDLPPYASAADAKAPDAAASAASSWVQSDAPELIAFARKATVEAKDPRARMLALQTAVSRHIDKKNLSVGYATALEALRMREGDCTEHALLLAAAGRAVGVPTRVAVGLAYVDEFAGHHNAFVPHAWVQAWLDGRWTSFDAALGRFDSGHIALATGSGDPATFFGSINLLGNLKIDSIERVAH